MFITKEELDKLDRAVPKEGALVRIERSHKPWGDIVTGNQLGLLRFGIESIRAGLEQPEEAAAYDADHLNDLRYVQGKEPEQFWFRRHEEIEKLVIDIEPKPWKDWGVKQKILSVIGYFYICLVFSVLGVGLYTIYTWITC